MKTVAKFEKVSYAQFRKDWLDTLASTIISNYQNAVQPVVRDMISLPQSILSYTTMM